MPKPSGAGGVCLACKFDPECIYEATDGRVALECEQFEMAFLKPPTPTPSIHENQLRNIPRQGKESNGYRGLCSNCDNRETCIHPKPEGGVWRCEEYV